MSSVKRSFAQANDSLDSQIVLAECLSLITVDLIENRTDSQSLDRSRSYVGQFKQCKLIYSSNPKKYELKGTCKYTSRASQPYDVSIIISYDNEQNSNKWSVDSSCSCPSFYHWCKHIAGFAHTFRSQCNSFQVIMSRIFLMNIMIKNLQPNVFIWE